MRPKIQKKDLYKLSALVLLTAFTISLHLTFVPVPHILHLVHRRLCYFPIVLGSLWFGLRGGLTVATVISLATLPLALEGGHGPFNEDMTEIFFYMAIALFSGVLVEGIRKERKKSEELSRRLIEKERLAALGQMSASVAHEIRTPLSSLKGSLEILDRDFDGAHPHREFVSIMDEELVRLERVVNDFMDLSKPLSLKNSVLLEGNSVAGKAISSVEAFSRSEEVRIDLVESSGKVFFEGDPERMHQALTNLLKNAVQASPRGSSVRFAVSSERGDVLFAVDDEGTGFRSADSERIFEPFYTKKEGGTGLGLAIVKMIVEAHKGKVSARLLPERGSSFEVRIPESPRSG